MQKITFATNAARNTLAHLKLLLTSLQHNLDNKEHEILIFVDSDNEGTVEYLESIKNNFVDLKIIENKLPFPVGYQRNKTLLTEYATHDIISYLQSDMVIGPHYDTEVLQHVKKGRILSATRVEPPLHGESPVTVTNNLGLVPEEFDMDAWNAFSNTVKRDELINYFFAPITYYKEDWMRLDGYDTVFRRAREDSDLVQRCLHAGIELVQTFSANVYHFTCVASRGEQWFDANNKKAQDRAKLQQVADSIEIRRFLRKWGNFNHGEEKLFKLDIDLVVKNYRLDIVETIEPFFSRVWLSNIEDKNYLISRYNKYHSVANQLLYFTEEAWEAAKYLFRVEDFDTVFMIGEPSSFAIKVEIDFNTIPNQNAFLNNLQNLYPLLSSYEPGEYELDGVKIYINEVRTLPVDIKAQNSKFDYTVLTIY